MIDFNPHTAFHQTGRTDPDNLNGCPECAINVSHQDRFDVLVAEFGSPDQIPVTEMVTLQESTRMLWLGFTNSVTASDTHGPKRDKTTKMEQFIKEFHGKEATLQEMMDYTGAADGTVYGLIRDMPLNFRKVGTSRYFVIDAVAARAAAKAAASAPGSPAAASAAPDGATDDAAAIAAFLAPARRTFAGPAPA